METINVDKHFLKFLNEFGGVLRESTYIAQQIQPFYLEPISELKNIVTEELINSKRCEISNNCFTSFRIFLFNLKLDDYDYVMSRIFENYEKRTGSLFPSILVGFIVVTKRLEDVCVGDLALINKYQLGNDTHAEYFQKRFGNYINDVIEHSRIYLEKVGEIHKEGLEIWKRIS